MGSECGRGMGDLFYVGTVFAYVEIPMKLSGVQ